jgi:hypothetical protein
MREGGENLLWRKIELVAKRFFNASIKLIFMSEFAVRGLLVNGRKPQ